MLMLAFGFARRVAPSFAWANFSTSTRALDGASRRMFVEGTEGRRVEYATVHELSTSAEGAHAFESLVRPDPSSTDLEGRLKAYLALPEIFQTFLSRTVSASGEEVVLLTNVDAVASVTARRALEHTELHDTLHREGVTLLVTYRGIPPSTLTRAFDEVFQVEHLGESWPDALLAATRSKLLPGLLAPRPLRECWAALGLDPGLLP